MKKRSVFGVLLAVAVIFSSMATGTVFADTPIYNTAEPVSLSEEVVAYVNFGTEVESYGMTARMGEKPDITTTNKMGREGWVLDVKNKEDNAYIYFDVDDKVAKDVLDGSSYRVEVDYFDESISSLVMRYDTYERVTDAQEGYSYGTLYYKKKFIPKEIEFFEFKDTQTWKTYSWFLENPTFAGTMTDGADFRIGAKGYNMGYSRGDTPPVVGAVRLIKTNTRSLVDISVSSDNFGNNFFDGDEVKFKVSMDNTWYQYQSRSAGDWTADVTYSVYDGDGNLYARKSDVANIETMRTTTKEVSFDVDKYDLYSFIVEIKNEERGFYSKERTVFAYCKDASENLNPRHGIGASAAICDNSYGKEGTENLVRFIKNAGFGHVRMHFSGFYEMHQYYKDGYKPADVTWYKESFRDYMRMLKDEGIEILTYNGQILPFDPWGNRGPVTDTGRWAYTKQFDGLIDMIGETSDTMEIWNEMNGNTLTLAEGETKADVYAKLCKYLYPRIKEKHPDYTLVGMVPSNVKIGREGEVFFDQAFCAGAADYMDLISVHFYQIDGGHFTHDFFSEAQNTIDIAQSHGYNGPIWVTETGTSSNYNGVDSEEAQAWRDVQGYILLQQNEYFDRVYSFSAQDSHYDRDRTERESNFGMIEGMANVNEPVDDGEVDWSAKPKYLGFCNLNSLMYDAKYVETIMFNDVTGGFHFTRKDSGKDILALFSENPQQDVSVDLGTNKVTAYDFYGNAKEITSVDGKYTFNIDEAVMYVEGNFARCVKTETSLARVATAMLETDCGEEHTVRLENNTGKTLTAEISLFDNSLITCEKTVTVPNGGADVKIRVGNTALRKDEPVHITMSDGENTYFDGDLVMYMVPKVSITANAAIYDNNWAIRVTVNNISEKDTSGYIEIVNPTELTDSSRTMVNVSAHESKDYDIILDEKYTQSDFYAMLRYVPDVEDSNPTYVDKTFNFEYASKAITPPVIDGDLSEWTKGWINMDNTQNYKSYIGYFTPYTGIKDLSAKSAIMWDEENFYYAAEVTDDVYCCEGETLANAWKLDGIQLGLVLYKEDMKVRSDFEELMLVLHEGEPKVHRFLSKFNKEDITTVDNFELAITQSEDETKTYYEFKCPWKDLIPNFRGIKAGDDMLISICINDNDGEGGRSGAMLYGGGIEDVKEYANFKRIYINDK